MKTKADAELALELWDGKKHLEHLVAEFAKTEVLVVHPCIRTTKSCHKVTAPRSMLRHPNKSKRVGPPNVIVFAFSWWTVIWSEPNGPLTLRVARSISRSRCEAFRCRSRGSAGRRHSAPWRATPRRRFQ